MRSIASIALVGALCGCSYQGGEQWRRSACDPIVDAAERARCLDDATRPEDEYRRDMDRALEPQEKAEAFGDRSRGERG